MEKMLFAAYETLRQKPKEITLTQQCQVIALHDKHMILSCAVWHLRNGLIHRANKRKITQEDCNSWLHFSVAAAALSALPKGHFFMNRSWYLLHKLEMTEPCEKYTELENLSHPGSCATALERFQSPGPGRGVRTFGSCSMGDSKSTMWNVFLSGSHYCRNNKDQCWTAAPQ